MQSSCDKRRSEKQGEEMGGTFFDLDQRLEERLLVLLLERLQDRPVSQINAMDDDSIWNRMAE